MTMDHIATSGISTPVRKAHAGPGPGGVTVLRDVVSSYRDGAEERLLKMVSSTEDLGSLNEELHGRASDWPEQYHLDRQRANVLRAFDVSRFDRVLEVGAGCGAMSRYLAEVCPVVDALEPVQARAAVAAQRLRDLPGARVFAGELADLPEEPSYDLIVVIGVLEYVGGGTADLAPYLAFLEEIRRRLRPGGQLLLAIENKLGVKYLAGAPEDHSDRAYDGVEGYPIGSPARTFDRAALRDLFETVGLTPSVYSAFPDYKLTRTVLAESLMTHPSGLAGRLPRFPSPDWQTPRDFGPNEELLWRALVEAGQGAQHGNSFVVIATADGDPAALWPENRQAVFYNTDRRPGRATQTVVDAEGAELVFSRSLLGERRDSGGFTHRLPSGPLLPGEPLVDEIARHGPAFAAATLRQWREMVDRESSAVDGTPVDLVPHNMLIGADGALTFIDDEWRSTDWTADHVVARGLIWLCERLSTTPSVWQDRPSREALLKELADLIGFAPEGGWVAAAVAREAEMQTQLLRRGPGMPGYDEEIARTREELGRLLQLPMSPQRPKLGPLIAERDRSRAEATGLQQELNAVHDKLRQAGESLHDARRELDVVRNSAGFQALVRYRKAVSRVVPPGTRRWALYRGVGRTLRRLVS